MNSLDSFFSSFFLLFSSWGIQESPHFSEVYFRSYHILFIILRKLSHMVLLSPKSGSPYLSPAKSLTVILPIDTPFVHNAIQIRFGICSIVFIPSNFTFLSLNFKVERFYVYQVFIRCLCLSGVLCVCVSFLCLLP